MSGHIHTTPLKAMRGDMFAEPILADFPEHTDQVVGDTAAVLTYAPPELCHCAKAGLAARQLLLREQNDVVPIHSAEMGRMLIVSAPSVATRHHARVILKLHAKAEAKVHSVALDKVHFQEIADRNSLEDISAAALLVELLDSWSWRIDPLPLGPDSIQTSHGFLPFSSPAVAHLLIELSVHDDGIGGEGALDLVAKSLSAKKGRSVTPFRILAQTAFANSMAKAVFDQTKTIGPRRRIEEQRVLPRSADKSVQIAMRPTGKTTKVESDAVAHGATVASLQAIVRGGPK